MNDPTHGWEAHIVYDPAHIDFDRLYLLQRPGNGHIIRLISAEGDNSVIERLTDDGTTVSDWQGILLPRGAAAAIAAAVNPGPSTAELMQLKDTLNTERARVDRILNAALEPETPHG